MALTYPASLLSQDLPASIQFTVFKRTTIKSSSPVEYINLYMPEELSMPSTVKWGDEPLGVMGAGLAAARSGSSISQAAGNVGAAMGVGVAKWMATNGVAALGKMAGTSFSAEKAGTAASVGAGMITNPYLTAVFQGVDFRSFMFKFKFSPHSMKDCDLIDNIVRTFRSSSLPAASMGGAMMDYPDEFEIAYKFGGKPHPWLKKFKRAVLADIDVSYGIGDQWSQYRNGFPTMIVLNMKFKEIALVLRNDVEKDGY